VAIRKMDSDFFGLWIDHRNLFGAVREVQFHFQTNDYGAVLVLVMNGYGVPAMKIVRSMFETECNIHYLKSNPDAVRDYVDFNIIERKKIYDSMRTARSKAVSG
jgi:hypothetical protein